MLRTTLLLLASLAAVPARGDVISLRADEWCPYNCAPDDARPGFMIEVAKRVFEPAGHRVDYQVLNWARAIDETRAGKFSAIVGAARGDAEDFVFPAESLGLSASAFAVRKGDKWKFSGMDSLSRRTLGVIRGYSYDDALDAYIEKHKNSERRVQVVSGDNALELNLRKLQRGRIDTVVEGEYVLKYTIAGMKLGDSLRLAGTSSEPDPVYIAFSPDNPKSKQYAALLSEGIARLRETGELRAILARYGVSDWK